MDTFDQSIARSLSRTAVVRITLTEPPTGKRKQYDKEERGIDMEVMTAAADLAAGSDAVILRHPESVKTISKLIKALS